MALKKANCELLEQKEEESSGNNETPTSAPKDPQQSCPKSASALAEISSLLSIAMSKANVSLLYDEDDDAAALAIEVQPRVRSFNPPHLRAPPAKWSGYVLWQPSRTGTSGTFWVSILKMGRQIIECRDFDPCQTLEVVEFIKSHSFINTKWALCQGIRGAVGPKAATFSECYGVGESIERSTRCELLVSPEESPAVCSYCAEAHSRDGLKEETSFYGNIHSEEDLDFAVHEAQVKIEEEDEVEDPDFEYLGNEVSDGGFDEFEEEKDDMGATHPSRSSAIWKFFTVKDDSSATCNTCNKDLRGPFNNSTNNFKRHLMRRHKALYAELVEITAQNKQPSLLGVPPWTAKRSFLIWDYFVRVDKQGAVCNTCKKELKVHTSSNLTKHLMRMHKAVYAEYRAGRMRELEDADDNLLAYKRQAEVEVRDFLDEDSPCEDIFEDGVKYDGRHPTHPGDDDFKMEETSEDRDDQTWRFKSENLETTKPTGSPIWKYYTAVDENSATCNACKKTLRGPWRHSTNNYLRHLRRRHNLLFADVIKTKSNGTASDVNKDQNSTHVGYEDEKLQEFKGPELLKEGDSDSAHQDFSSYSMDTDHENLDSMKPTGSAMWEYFTARDENSAACNTCGKEIRGPWKQSTSNFMRHLMQRHSALHAELMKSKKMERKNRYELKGHLDYENHEGAEPTGSAIWKHFTVVDGTSASCHTCKKVLHGPWRQSTANYLRHLKMRHNLLFAELMGVETNVSGSTDTFVNQEKTPTNVTNSDETVESKPAIKKEANFGDDIIKVEKEDELESDPLSDDSSAKPMEDFTTNELTEGITQGGTNKILWKYFTRVDENCAKCNTCNKELRGPWKSSSSNYKRHLMRRHRPQYAELMKGKISLKNRLHDMKADDMLKKLKESLTAKGEAFPDSQNSIPGTTAGTTRKKSVLLDYFARKDRDTFTCNSCGNDVKAEGTNGNLAKHLLRNHEEAYLEYKSKRVRNLQTSRSDYTYTCRYTDLWAESIEK